MNNFYFHGDMGDKFGEHYKLNVHTPAQALRLLSFQLKGLKEYVKDNDFQIVKNNHPIAEVELLCGSESTGDVHFFPLLSGAKSGGVGKAVAGVALAAVAFAAAPAVVGALGPTQGLATTAFTAFGASVSFGSIALFGGAMALGGVAQMLAPTPQTASYQAQEAPDQRASFLLQGPTNTAQEGQPIPLVYGKIQAGSIIVSAGLTPEQI